MKSLERNRGGIPASYWLLGLALTAYVAACTGFRDNVLGADAWEHHRAILTLTRHLWHPGNPTYASDVPSVRYSPYSIFWALVCRATHITPYTALSIAAMVNTVLLLAAVWLLLDSFSEGAAASAVLIVMVLLWGGVPGWANSYALADLPWQQVNPSALAFDFILISWALFRRVATGVGSRVSWIAILVLMAIAMLDHGMTAAFGFMGLFVLAIMGPSGSRLKMFVGATSLAAIVAVICTAWPWYNFWGAVRWKGDPQYWFSAYFVWIELTQWIVPAVACSILALPLIRRPMVQVCALGGMLAVGAGVVSYFTHSPTLARFPMPGLIYFHLMVGLWAHDARIFRPSSWPMRMRAMLAPPEQSAFSILQTVLAIVLIICLEPQARPMLSKPYLIRPYIAGLLHRPDRQERLPRDLPGLLRGVGDSDVVLSDLLTSWLAPSFHGKIVAAMHYELFVPDQRQRWHDVTDFFATGSSHDRMALLRRYNVRWIVLNRQQLDDATFNQLLQSSAVVARAGDLVLMDAQRWQLSSPSTAPH